MPIHAGDKVPWDIPTGSTVIVVDLSFPRNQMLQLLEKCENNLVVIDHHKTGQEACEGLDFCIFDMNESGASLAWKHFFPIQPMPRLVEYIKDRDLWQFKLPNSEAVTSWIQSWPIDYKQYERLNFWMEKLPFGNIVSEGEAILRYKNTMVQAICNNATIKQIGLYDVPVVCASILFSEVGAELCKKYPKAAFGAYYFDRVKDRKRQWGLRSIGDFDVSVVAKSFGGGGHKNAAGFEQDLPEEMVI